MLHFFFFFFNTCELTRFITVGTEDDQKCAVLRSKKDQEITFKASSAEEIEAWVNAVQKQAECFGKPSTPE